MRIGKFGKFSPRVITTGCFTFLLLAMGTAILAQAQNWWVLPEYGAAPERGKIDEIKLKKKIYLNVTFEDAGPGQITSTAERDDIRKNILNTFKAHKELTIVSNAAVADFAVIVKTAAAVAGAESERGNFSVALEPDAEISVDVTVLVPGAKLADGTFKPRLVWQTSSSNVQMEPGVGAAFVVNGFLWELKKLREGK